MKRKMMIITLASAVVLQLSSCKKDKQDENDEEVLTTLNVKLTPVGGGNAITFTYDDPDGPGGNPATQQTIALQANKVYNVSLEVLNKTTNPVTDITPEIVSEGASHRFYYTQTVGNNIAVSNLSKDANNVSLGQTSTWTTTTAGNGKLQIVLRHYSSTPPNKAEADAVNSSKSATDMEVTFDTSVN